MSAVKKSTRTFRTKISPIKKPTVLSSPLKSSIIIIYSESLYILTHILQLDYIHNRCVSYRNKLYCLEVVLEPDMCWLKKLNDRCRNRTGDVWQVIKWLGLVSQMSPVRCRHWSHFFKSTVQKILSIRLPRRLKKLTIL